MAPSTPDSSPAMKVLIVGAGIAGLSLAIMLRKRGVTVEVLERTSLLSEVGAAISIAPNSARILQSFGFDPRRAHATNAGPQYEYNEDGVIVDSLDLRDIASDAGAPWWFLHRADLQSELLRIATVVEMEGWGDRVTLRLDCNIVGVDCENGVVISENGEHFQGDLIVGADGVKSIIRQEVTGRKEEPSVYSGHSAFRSLYNVEELRQDPELHIFVNEIKMEDWVGKDGRRCLLYPCRNNTILNLFAPVFWDVSESTESWRATGKTSDLIEQFSKFPKPLQKLLSKDPSPGLWQIRDRDPVRNWHRQKAIIIGDAAHPMLPHQGQGGAQAIEDAASLPIFLFDAPTGMGLMERLKAFEGFRYPRVTSVQERSRQQKQGPKPRKGKLPSIEMWSEIGEQVSYDVVKEAINTVYRLSDHKA